MPKKSVILYPIFLKCTEYCSTSNMRYLFEDLSYGITPNNIFISNDTIYYKPVKAVSIDSVAPKLGKGGNDLFSVDDTKEGKNRMAGGRYRDSKVENDVVNIGDIIKNTLSDTGKSKKKDTSVDKLSYKISYEPKVLYDNVIRILKLCRIPDVGVDKCSTYLDTSLTPYNSWSEIRKKHVQIGYLEMFVHNKFHGTKNYSKSLAYVLLIQSLFILKLMTNNDIHFSGKINSIDRIDLDNMDSNIIKLNGNKSPCFYYKANIRKKKD